MRTGEPPEVAEPTLVIPDNPGGLFSPGRSILDGFCASVRGSYGENAIRGSGVTTPREASLPQALVSASRCGRSRFWWTQLGTLHIPCGVPRAQVQALALLMQCRSAAPLVVGLGWVFASTAWFFSGSMRTLGSCTKPGSTQPLHPKSAPGQNLLAIYGTLPEQPPALSAPSWSTECCWGSLSGMMRYHW